MLAEVEKEELADDATAGSSADADGRYTNRTALPAAAELHRLVSVNMVTPCAVVLVGLESEERVEATIER